MSSELKRSLLHWSTVKLYAPLARVLQRLVFSVLSVAFILTVYFRHVCAKQQAGQVRADCQIWRLGT